MKRVLILFFAAVMLSACHSDKELITDIIPHPQSVEVSEGFFEIHPQCHIVIDKNDTDIVHIAGFLNERLDRAAGFMLPIKEFSSNNEAIIFNRVDGLADEAYRLTVNRGEIVVESSTSSGAFYALQTLLQLLPTEIYAAELRRGVEWRIPCVKIEDAPRFSYRGMHLDVCSHFFSVDYIKRYIDLMAMHKINRFHWHLTEDQGWRIEIKKYPLLTEKGSVRKETIIGSYASNIYDGTPYGGYYTQDEIREVVQYAADRFITVIPEIEMPGHALAAIACYPELSCGLEESYEVGTKWGVYKQVYCPKEATFEFLENVLTEVFELFPSKLIHIGGDECPKNSWKACPHCQSMIKRLGLKDEFELQSYFIQRIEKFVNANNREIIGWDEILQGGLAPNAKVMSWLGEEGGIKSAQQHHEVIMSPHNRYYLDYYQADPNSENICMGHKVTLQDMYEYNPVPEVLTPEQRQYIIGVEGCVWTEYMATPQRVEYMAYPRMCAISESAWSSEYKDWNDFTMRLEHHFARLDELKVSYCRSFYDVQIDLFKDSAFTRVVKMKIDCPDVEIHYTLDGSDPDRESAIYTQPFVINRSQTVKAIGVRNGKPVGNITSNKII